MKKTLFICLGYMLYMLPVLAQDIPYRIDDHAPDRLWKEEMVPLCLCGGTGKATPTLAVRRLQPGDVIILDVMRANKNSPDIVGTVFSEPEGSTIKIPIRWVRTDKDAVRLRNYELSFLYQIIITNRTKLPVSVYSLAQEDSIWNYVMQNLIVYKNTYDRVVIKIDFSSLAAAADYIKDLFTTAKTECWTELIIPVSTEKNIGEVMNLADLKGLECTNDKYYATAFTTISGREFDFNAYSVLLKGCKFSYNAKGPEGGWSLFDWLYSGILSRIPNDTTGEIIRVKREHAFLFWQSRRYKFLPGKGENEPITLSEKKFINKILYKKKRRNGDTKLKRAFYINEETLKEIQIAQINKIKSFVK